MNLKVKTESVHYPQVKSFDSQLTAESKQTFKFVIALVDTLVEASAMNERKAFNALSLTADLFQGPFRMPHSG